MTNEKEKRNCILLLMLVIMLCVGVAVLHGHYKEYFYEDEVLSYTLSNSHNGAYFDISAGEWYNGSDLYDYLYVHKGEEFDWSNVIHNQRQDSHPPVYALLLHAFSSLFSGDFSKWAGIILNLVGFAVMLVGLYLTVSELFPERKMFSIIVCLICGMSVGMQVLAVYIRMYMILMPLAVFCVYWHIRMIKKTAPRISDHLVLAVLTYMGIMTHWFYIILEFYAALFYCVYMLYHMELKRVCYYILSMVVTAGIMLLTWRDHFWQLFIEDTGNDAVTQDWSIEFILHKIREMTDLVNDILFDGKMYIVLGALVCLGFYIVIKYRKKIKASLCEKTGILFIVFTTLLYYLTASAITPYVAYRYVSPVFPFIILFAILILKKVMTLIIRFRPICLVILVFCFLLPEVRIIRAGLEDVNRRIIDQYSTEHSGDLCLFHAGITPEENVFELRKFDRIYAYSELVFSGVEGVADADELLIYVPDGEEPEPYFDAVQKANPSLKYKDRLYVAYYSTCYIMTENNTGI